MKHRSISIILLFIVSAMLIGIFAGCEGIGNATEAEAAESTNGMYDEYILTEEDLAELNEAYFHTLLYFDSSLSELDEATLNELRNIPNNMFSQTVEGAMSRPAKKHEGSRYYVGKYGECIVYFHIANEIIMIWPDSLLYVCYNSRFYKLETAHENGWISDSDITMIRDFCNQIDYYNPN